MRSHLGPSTLEICGLFRLERAMKGQRSGAFFGRSDSGLPIQIDAGIRNP